MTLHLPFISQLSKRYKRWNRHIALTKRQQFVIITLLLTSGLLLTQLVSVELRYPMVGFLSAVTFVLAAFALREDLKGIEWVTLLTLPTLFTAAVSLFYFLLPVRWLTRLPVAVLYGIGMYALLLTENIYNVAAIRTIALLRAAHSVGFLLTLVTYFFLLQTLFAFRLYPWWNALAVGCVSFLLVLQSVWAMELEGRASRRAWQISLALSVALSELAWILSFLPIKTTLQALFLTTAFYSLTGMSQQYVVEKLYKKTVIEFFAVSLIVFAIMMFTVQWRGNF